MACTWSHESLQDDFVNLSVPFRSVFVEALYYAYSLWVWIGVYSIEPRKKLIETLDFKLIDHRIHASHPIHIDFSIGVILAGIIGKYLSRLRKFDQVIALQERFEAQPQAPRLAITFGMRALGMRGQIRDGRFQRGIESCDVPGLQGLDNPA